MITHLWRGANRVVSTRSRSLILALLGATISAEAAPQLARDICPASGTPSLAPVGLDISLSGVSGEVVYFRAHTPTEGYELWRTDGTFAGTRLVRDLYPGPRWDGYSSLTRVGDAHYFSGNDGSGHRLWRTDGTAAGTVPICEPGEPVRPFEFNGSLFYAAPDAADRYFLWKSDGTGMGTTVSTAILGFSSSEVRLPVGLPENGSFFFLASAEGETTASLWKSDGTPAGTTRLLLNGASIQATGTFAAGGFLYFNAQLNGTAWFCRTDGTEPGTVQIRPLAVYADVSSGARVAELHGVLYFQAWDPQSGAGVEPWRSDGTATGTWLLKDCSPGTISSHPYHFTTFQNRVYFAARRNGHTVKLWRSDGTTAGTSVVDTPDEQINGPAHLTVLRDKLYFRVYPSAFPLWMSDGTDEGTTSAAGLFEGMDIGAPYLVGATSETLFLGTSGAELLKTDGTPAGTALVRSIPYTRGSSSPQAFADLNGTLLFTADDGAHGRELWRSGGTAESTSLVRDLLQVGSYGFFSNTLPPTLRHAGGQVYFAGNSGGYAQLMKSDGSAEGTTVVLSFSSPIESMQEASLTELGNKLFFNAWTFQYGLEPWITDGTPAGTAILADLDPSIVTSGMYAPFGASSSPSGMVVHDGRIFFSAHDTTFRTLIYSSDGTTSGTRGYPASPAATYIQGLGFLENTLLFSCNAGAGGMELWKLDEGEEVPELVKDIRPGSPGAFLVDIPAVIVSAGGVAYFVASDGVHGQELWRSDGTEAGTTLIRDIHPGASSSRIQPLYAVGPEVYFAADDGLHGMELWRSDGTEAGTVQVADVAPGKAGSFPTALLQPTSKSALLFVASDGVHGQELWRTTGTPASTEMVSDLAPGGFSSSPADLTVSGGRLYFSAGRSGQSGDEGVELWSIPLPDVSTATSADPAWSLYR